MRRNPRRAWLLVLTLVSTMALAGCGSDKPSDTPTWQSATSASGNYVAEFPGVPTTRTQEAPGTGLSLELTEFESGGTAFTMSETALNGVAPYPLDDAVDNSIESARAGQESSTGRSITANEISRATGDFEGVETRKVTYDLVDGEQKSRISSLIFYRNDAIVQVVAVTGPGESSESADRFVSSVKVHTG